MLKDSMMGRQSISEIMRFSILKLTEVSNAAKFDLAAEDDYESKSWDLVKEIDEAVDKLSEIYREAFP